MFNFNSTQIIIIIIILGLLIKDVYTQEGMTNYTSCNTTSCNTACTTNHGADRGMIHSDHCRCQYNPSNYPYKALQNDSDQLYYVHTSTDGSTYQPHSTYTTGHATIEDAAEGFCSATYPDGSTYSDVEALSGRGDLFNCKKDVDCP